MGKTEKRSNSPSFLPGSFVTSRHFSRQLPFGRTASQGSFLRASPDMISVPSSAALPGGLLRASGCGAASRRRKGRRFGGGWEAGCFSGLEFCRSFPAPTSISTEEKKKLFTRDTARNYRAKLTSGLGEQQDPAPSRGTRKTSSARGGGGEGASARGLGTGATPSRRRRRDPAAGTDAPGRSGVDLAG